MKIDRQKCELVEIIFEKDEMASVTKLMDDWNVIQTLYSGPVTKDYKMTGKYRRYFIAERNGDY
jgi:hypothetical protein